MADDPENPPQNDPPPAGDPPPPDPNGAAELARLQTELTNATGSVQRAFDTTRDALRTANPNLPDTVFEGADNLDSLIANVESHRATALHVAENAKANPGPGTPPDAGTKRTVTVPANVHGTSRIAHALKNPGPGMTE